MTAFSFMLPSTEVRSVMSTDRESQTSLKSVVILLWACPDRHAARRIVNMPKILLIVTEPACH